MRSSVCALNAATGDNFNMNFPDYEQTSAHHSCLLVLIRGIGVDFPLIAVARSIINENLFRITAQQAQNVAENLRKDTKGQQR
jgi:hypothetical protein